jgi:hypothetical protein
LKLQLALLPAFTGVAHMFKLTPAIRQALLEDALVDNLLTAAKAVAVPPRTNAALETASARAVLAGSKAQADSAAHAAR